MAIDYEVTTNIIKTIDVDGLIIPFNKGQETTSSYNHVLAFDTTAILNFALAIDMTDIFFNFMNPVLSKIKQYISSHSPTKTTNTYDEYSGVNISEKIPDIIYTAYNGIKITVGVSGGVVKVPKITVVKEINSVPCRYVTLDYVPMVTINEKGIGTTHTQYTKPSLDANYFVNDLGSYADYKLFFGGYYFDDYYATGVCWANVLDGKRQNFNVLSYNNSLLTYNDLKSNTKLKGTPISVTPTEHSQYIYFATVGSRVLGGQWPPPTSNNRMYQKYNDKDTYYDAGYGLYDKNGIKSFYRTENEPSEEKEPYQPGGEGGEPYTNDPDYQGNNDPGGHKGGNGKYQDTDEDVPIPGLPQISAVDTGLCTLLNPTNEQLEKLSNFLWSDVFSLDSFKKIFADPMDVILGLSIVPLKVASDIMRRINISGIDTGVEMYKCASQYIEVDCGSIDINNYWDNFMDYEPYTQYTIYLPYVGYKVLHADELVDKTITVKYHCDILSGACMAYVQCGKKVLYCFEGNISIQIPVTSASYDNMIHGMLQVASGVGQIIAGGASMAAGGAGAGLMVSGAVGTATGATSAIKPTIGRSGNAESSTGLMGIQKPYLIISRPRAVVPSGLNKYSGYPAYKGGKLGDFNNFTVVQDIRIKNLNGATMEEMNEAERLCKEGVIV